MGAITLTLNCAGSNVTVQNQEQLLAKMYQGCTLPSNYVSILSQ
jgi:hypothetical protein